MDVLDWIIKAKAFNQNEFLNDFAYEISDDDEFQNIQRKQWNEGLSSEGEPIGFYKKRTEEITGGRKKFGELWNLNETGDFWKKTYLATKVKRGSKADISFEYGSDGKNKRKLFRTIRQHGLIVDPNKIFGLHDPYMEIMIRNLEPKFINQLEKYYNGM